MAKSKSSPIKKSIHGKTKYHGKPKWKRLVRAITIVTLSIVLLMAIAGILIKYYRLISKH